MVDCCGKAPHNTGLLRMHGALLNEILKGKYFRRASPRQGKKDKFFATMRRTRIGLVYPTWGMKLANFSDLIIFSEIKIIAYVAGGTTCVN